MIEIYTDGACSSADNTGGWAVIIVGEPLLRPTPDEYANLFDGAKYGYDTNQNCTYIVGSKSNTTNNEMELCAMQVATYVAASYLCEPATIHTDSAYISNCFKDKWYTNWEKNGWRTSRKTPVEHKELWKAILHNYANAQKTINVQHVRAHNSIPYNNLADNYAVKARLQLREDNAEKYACRDN